jgi:DNA-binding XRE family transcriptional regulator
LAFLSTVNSSKAPSAPQTRRADIVQWESCFRPQDVPVPEGFEDIDAYMEARERDPAQFDALKAARRRVAEKLPASKITLAKLRLNRGWSQKRLADAIGTSQPHIARIENGRDNVLLSTANELSRALEVSLDDINKALGYASNKK